LLASTPQRRSGDIATARPLILGGRNVRAACASTSLFRGLSFLSRGGCSGSGFWGRCHDAFSFRGDYHGEDIVRAICLKWKNPRLQRQNEPPAWLYRQTKFVSTQFAGSFCPSAGPA